MASLEELGATVESDGVTFRLLSHNATAADVCLFDDREQAEAERVSLTRNHGGIWSVHVPGIGPGQLYGYRVDGPYQPEEGHRFNPHKLLVDPCARAVAGSVKWNEALVGCAGGEEGDRDPRDSARYQARAVVMGGAFDWGDDRPPKTSWGETVIYECHVRGLTKLHPGVSRGLRGTYLALASEPVVEHLKDLGVTAVELMPVQHFVSERHLLERGAENYWGYSPLAWFAPHAGYATNDRGAQVDEFRQMVRRLHLAGLEVILDMVFNHTAEGDQTGPTLSLRGVDNALYYRLCPEDRGRYEDFTGCGNTVDAGHPQVAELILSCLRYWVREMRVDGFRFDLATSLGREHGVFSSRASLLESISADPVLSGTKLIAEPWDLGPSGYHLGSFPPGWAGWNDRYRDTVRSFWRGDPGRRKELAGRIAGSCDILAGKRRGPLGGINFVSSHDGFTLEDLVCYREKHNQANLEDNRDGAGENLSCNWGVEGPTERKEIEELRARAKRNLLATLALSHGVPMLAHGDELSRTQLGNNNAYCQDGPVTWLSWRTSRRAKEFLEFSRRVLGLRKRLGVFSEARFPTLDDIVWLSFEGRYLEEEDWRDLEEQTLAIGWRKSPEGPLLLCLNAGDRARAVHLPALESHDSWRELLNTAVPESRRSLDRSLELPAHSLILLKGGHESS